MSDSHIKHDMTQEKDALLEYREIFAAYLSKEPYIFEVMEELSTLSPRDRKFILSVVQIIGVMGSFDANRVSSEAHEKLDDFLAMPFLSKSHNTQGIEQILT
ncbi:MAG: hypothetical protein LCH38_06515 [Proteobacteria bacterium]|nr:hypothetical protein [Pseudomonadota bacterium]